MKRGLLNLLGFILVLISCVSCADKVDERPTMSFRRSIYILPGSGELEVELVLSEPATQDFAVTFSIGGDAVESEEYVLSAHQFDIAEGEATATITVLPANNFTAGRELNLTLNESPLYQFGYYQKTMIPIEARTNYVAKFLSEENYLYEQAEIAGELYIGTTKYTSPLYNILIPIEVDTTLSTAVLGEHYEFVGGTEQMFFAMNTYCPKGYVKFLKKEVGKDQIAVRIAMSDYITVSDKNYMYINIEGPIGLDDLDGEWSFKQLSSQSYIESNAKMAAWDDDLVGLPTGSSSDVLRFCTADGVTTLDVSGVESSIKNYFDGSSVELSSNGVICEQRYEQSDIFGLYQEMLSVNLANANVNFSATNISKRAAKMNVRLLDSKQTLEIRLFDYEPTDFLVAPYQYFSGQTLSWFINDYTLVYQFERKN